jgi:hypothetical protein
VQTLAACSGQLTVLCARCAVAAVEHLGNKPDCAHETGTTAPEAAAAAAAAGPDMVAEVSLSPVPSAAAAAGYASPEGLSPLSTVREESGSMTSRVASADAAAADAAAAPAASSAAAAAAVDLPVSCQAQESSGELSPMAPRIHSDLTPFAQPHHNFHACPPAPSAAAAAAAGSSSNAPAGVVPYRFQSFAVADEEPSEGAKKLALYDSSQVVLVHKECLLHSTKAQQLVGAEDLYL